MSDDKCQSRCMSDDKYLSHFRIEFVSIRDYPIVYV
jgi:hypothetical protein